MKPYHPKYICYSFLIILLILSGCISSKKSTGSKDDTQIRRIFQHGNFLMLLSNNGLYKSSLGTYDFHKVSIPFSDQKIKQVDFEESILVLEHSITSVESEIYYSLDTGITWKKLELPYSKVCFLGVDLYKELIVVSNNNASHGCDLKRRDTYEYYSLDFGGTWKIYDSLARFQKKTLDEMYNNIKTSIPARRFSARIFRLGLDTIINYYKRDKLKLNGMYFTTYNGHLFWSFDSLGHWDTVTTSNGTKLEGMIGNKSVIMASDKAGVYYLMTEVDTSFQPQGLVLTNEWDRVYVGEKHFWMMNHNKIIYSDKYYRNWKILDQFDDIFYLPWMFTVSDNIRYIIPSSLPDFILKTDDGGDTWKKIKLIIN